MKDYLIINSPDDPVEIAKKAKYAMENRKEILDLYNIWKKENDIASELSIQRFLEEN